jgi:hypothetical protein
MKIIYFCIALTMWLLASTLGHAQDIKTEEKIEKLIELKESVISEEKEALKLEVENINARLVSNAIAESEAEELKKAAAERHALNIENRLAIIDNKVALLKRNKDIESDEDGSSFVIHIGGDDDVDNSTIYIGRKDKERKYDKKTTSSFMFATGFNNAIMDGSSLSDSPYSIGKSGFVELGLAWKTRVLQNSNIVRLKYGLSFQWNKLAVKDNKYFVQNGNTTTLEEYPVDLNKAKLRITNLVVPVHFEFGPSKKVEHKDYFRYSTVDQFKFGIGGYAGVNIGARQKLKYEVDGEKVKDKLKKSYNASPFVYGLSGYIGFDSFSLYGKYDLSPLFENQLTDQKNISLGLRMDLD